MASKNGGRGICAYRGRSLPIAHDPACPCANVCLLEVVSYRDCANENGLFLNRARDLITHGPAHRGANGAAMPTDEDDQNGHFFFNHPERGGYPAA